MTTGPLDIVRGSGNVFEDFGLADASVRQAKALIGTQILRLLDSEHLSTRQAGARTGISHAGFSRIRQAKFSRFTIDRLVTILSRLGQDVELSVQIRPRSGPGAGVAAIL